VDKVGDNNLKYLIDKLSEQNNVFPLSIYELGEKPVNIINQFSKLDIVFVIKTSDETKEILYIHKSNFYIYINKKDFQFCDVKILFEPLQLSEVEFFINRISKL
jgi:hypothetical protein